MGLVFLYSMSNFPTWSCITREQEFCGIVEMIGDRETHWLETGLAASASGISSVSKVDS